MDEGRGGEAIDWRRWAYAGPVAKAYEASRAPVAMIQGPVGGGKSTASARRCLRVATWQHPSPRDGIRKARVVCVCPTYRRAWDTVMPSYFKVFPQSLGEFRGSRGDPADHAFEMNVRLGAETARARVEVLFRAVNELDIEDFLRGFEFTALWLPEADTNGDLDQLLSLGATRVGRYPEPDDRPTGAPDAYAGIFGDANAPIIGSAFYRRFHLRQAPNDQVAPETDRLFKQPSGFDPRAENMVNLRKIRSDFYQFQASQIDKYDVRRMIQNQPGYGRHGKPVQENFDIDVHVSKVALRVEPWLPVYISVDKGSGTLHPAAVFWQRTPEGQWRALREIHNPVGTMDTVAFAERIRQIYAADFEPHLARDVGALICGDPALAARRSYDELSEALELQAATEIEVQLAPTNKLSSRRSALNWLFLKNIRPGEPRILIDQRCVGLIEALTGAWHYPKKGTEIGMTPKKNVHSHIGEAAEYGPLTIDGVDPKEGRFIRPDGDGDYPAPVAIYD